MTHHFTTTGAPESKFISTVDFVKEFAVAWKLKNRTVYHYYDYKNHFRKLKSEKKEFCCCYILLEMLFLFK